jgi:hypothetical protein
MHNLEGRGTMTVEELEDALEQALARIKKLENALLAISLDADAGEEAVKLALDAMKEPDD